jgi:hypothetical protein
MGFLSVVCSMSLHISLFSLNSGTRPAIPAANGEVSINYAASNGTTTLSLPTAKVNEIMEKSKDGEAVLDLSKVSGTNATQLPKSALTAAQTEVVKSKFGENLK